MLLLSESQQTVIGKLNNLHILYLYPYRWLRIYASDLFKKECKAADYYYTAFGLKDQNISI